MGQMGCFLVELTVAGHIGSNQWPGGQLCVAAAEAWKCQRRASVRPKKVQDIRG